MARHEWSPVTRRLAFATLVAGLAVLGCGRGRADAPPAPASPGGAAAGRGGEAADTTVLAPRPDSAGVRAATVNPTIRSIRKVKLDKKPDNVVRSGPGESFSIVGVFPRNASFVVIAKSGDWYNIRL